MAIDITCVLCEFSDLFKSVRVLIRLASKDALCNPPHLTAPLVQGAQVFVLHLETAQRALGSVHSTMDYAPVWYSHCESFLNAATESLQYV